MQTRAQPTKTPTAKSGAKPTNQASRLALVVPVFPASGLWICRPMRTPVPRFTTPSSMETI